MSIVELDHFVAAVRYAHAGNIPRARLELWICGDLEEWDPWAAGLPVVSRWEQTELFESVA